MYESFPYVEPCCSQIQLNALMKRTENRGISNFFTHSDVKLQTLLNWFALYAPMGNATFVCKHLPDRMTDIFGTLLGKNYYDGTEEKYKHLIQNLVLIVGQENDNTTKLVKQYGDRVNVVIYENIAFSCFTLTYKEKGIILQGNFDQEEGDGKLQMFTLQCGVNLYKEVHKVIDPIVKFHAKTQEQEELKSENKKKTKNKRTRTTNENEPQKMIEEDTIVSGEEINLSE